MCLLLILAALFLFASPASAQYTPPDRDEDGCIALVAKMDADAKAKRKPTAYEQEQYDLCVTFMNCAKASNDEPAWDAASATNEKLIRFVLKTCTGYDPKPLSP